MYINSTGAFPVQSFRNMQYVFVAHIHDLNAILVRAMPSKTDGAMIAAFTDILANLNAHGYSPTLSLPKKTANHGILGIVRKLSMRQTKLLHLIKANLYDLTRY